MTLLDILAIVLPPSAAYAYDCWTKVQRTTAENESRQELARMAYTRDASREKSEEERTAILANADELQRLKTEHTTLSALVQEQQLTLNRIADRF